MIVLFVLSYSDLRKKKVMSDFVQYLLILTEEIKGFSYIHNVLISSLFCYFY